MFIATLFTVTKTWKQHKCPLTGEWVRKTWCMNTVEYFSAIKRNGVMPFAAAWIDLEIISEINHKEKDRYHTLSLIYGISTETDSQT